MKGKFDVIYINHTVNNHDEWANGNQNKREANKKGRYQLTIDCENSTGSGGSGKCLALYSHIQYELCTNCGMSQAEITKYIGFYNQKTRGEG